MPHYPFTPEQSALLICARTSWDRRRIAKARSLSFSEESITETILMDLAETFPGRLDIVQFSKNQEGKRGADWAWAFSNDAKTKILPMLVQAKLLDRQDKAYPEIARLIGKKLPPIRQIDRLIATANSYRWPALYAFYNHLDDPRRIPDHCSTIPKAGLVMPECWGVSVALAEDVRDALDPQKDQLFNTHSQHSLPLHCLLCSRATGKRPIEGSPVQVLSALNRLKGLRAKVTEQKNSNFRIYPSLPAIFKRALEAAQADLEQPDSGRVEALAKSYPRLAGVVVVQDGEVGAA